MAQSPRSDASPNGANDIDLLQITGIIFSRKWIPVATTLIAVAAGFAYLKLTPPVYRATALLEVPQNPRSSPTSPGLDYLMGEDFGGDEVLKTVERNLQRISLLSRVVERPEISKHPALQAGFAEPVESMTSLAQAEVLQANVEISLETGTRLIAVSAKHRDPQFAQELSNTIVKEFMEERSKMTGGNSESTLKYLVEEAERIGAELQQSQTQLQAIEEAVAIHEKIEEQKDVLQMLSGRYGENHPLVQQARSPLISLTRRYNAAMVRVLPSRGEGVNGPTPGTEDSEAEFEMIRSRLKILTGEVQTSQALHQEVLSLMKQADLAKQLYSGTLKISESAQLPSKPENRSPAMVLGASVVLGGGVGLFLILALHLMNRTLRTVSEAQICVGLQVIGAIPQDRWRTRISDPGGATAEAFRNLRAELLLLEEKKSANCYLVTSAVPGEGKSFVAANLAVAFAEQEERKTLLVDAGLRRPTIDRIFDLDDVGQGLGGVLGRRDGSWKSEVRQSRFPNLDLLPAGSAISKPAELLSGRGLEALLRELAENYACVVIDSPAVNSVADGLLVAGHPGKSILVAAAGRTHRAAVIRASELLTNVGSQPIGLVLNRLPRRAGFWGNPYYYHFGAAGRAYRKNYRGK